MNKIWFGVAVVVFLFYFFKEPSALRYPPGILVTDEPAQEMLKDSKPEFIRAGYILIPLATYSINARILLKKPYGDLSFDSKSDLSPLDLAVGWGPMSDQKVLDQLRMGQSNRFYHWNYFGEAPIPEKEIINSSANMHIIPKDNVMLDYLESLPRGTLVHLTGYLIQAKKLGTEVTWTSSLTRGDDGDGACEIMWVENAEKIYSNIMPL